MHHTYTIQTLPKSHPNPKTWTTLLAAYKFLRLHALQTSPSSFSSTYAREAAFTPAEWEARLQNPLALTLVAIPTPAPTNNGESTRPGPESDATDADAWIESEWAGTAVLFGPVHSSLAADEESSEDLVSPPTFEIFALFVRSAARGRGLATRLVDGAVARARETVREQGGGEDVDVRVTVTAGNGEIIALYRKCGFEVVKDAGNNGGSAEVAMVRRERGPAAA